MTRLVLTPEFILIAQASCARCASRSSRDVGEHVVLLGIGSTGSGLGVRGSAGCTSAECDSAVCSPTRSVLSSCGLASCRLGDLDV